MDNICSQRNKEKFCHEGFLYIFDRLTEVEKCGAASIRTTVAERGYTPVL